MLIGSPSRPVWWVTSCWPNIFAASSRTWSGVSVSFTPPALPRPPAWTWALTTQLLPPISSAALAASSALRAGTPRETGMPYSANSCFAWYSWRFIPERLQVERPVFCHISQAFNDERLAPHHRPRVRLAHAAAAERLPAALRRPAVRHVHLPVRPTAGGRAAPRPVPRRHPVGLRLGGAQRLRGQPALALGGRAGRRPGRVRHRRHQRAGLGQRRAGQRRRQPADHHHQRAGAGLIAAAGAGLRGAGQPGGAGEPGRGYPARRTQRQRPDAGRPVRRTADVPGAGYLAAVAPAHRE